MKNLKITKILLSLMLMVGLTTSSFAMGQGQKVNHDGKAKVEEKIEKKDVKGMHVAKKEHKHHKDVKVTIKDNHKHDVKIAKDGHHRHNHKHHKVHYSANNNNDLVAKCVGTGLCLAMIAAINS